MGPDVRKPTSTGVIFLVLFLDLVGFSILFPLYADMLDFYGRQQNGLLAAGLDWLARTYPTADPHQRIALFGGLLGAFYSLLQFVSAPFWGRLSDRLGRRPILLACVAGSFISYLLWAFSGSFTLLLVSRLIAGCMGGSVAAANAAVADITDSPQARARGMGFVGMAFGLGFVLGPVIGAAGYHFLPKLETGGDFLKLHQFSMPALLACSLSLINLIWAFRRFRETLPPERRQAAPNSDRTANPARLFSPALGQGVMTINGSQLLHTILFAGMESTLVFLTWQHLAFEVKHNGIMFGGMGLMAALMQGFVFRRLAPKTGARPLVILGFLILIPGYALIGLVDYVPSTLNLIVGITVLAAGTGLVFPGLSTLVSLAANDRNQGLAMGTFRSAGSLGRAIGPLLAALLYFKLRPAGPYFFGAVGTILPLVLMILFRPSKQQGAQQ
jgi:MFS family permease